MESRHGPPDLLDAGSGILQALNRAEILSNPPYRRILHRTIPPEQRLGRRHVLRHRLLAEDVLAGGDCFPDHVRLGQDREADHRDSNVGSREQIIERLARGGGVVEVDIDRGLGLARELLGRLLGARVDRFKLEIRRRLDRRQMFCFEGGFLSANYCLRMVRSRELLDRAGAHARTHAPPVLTLLGKNAGPEQCDTNHSV